MKISATIITLNEERNIARCIDSLVHIADEVLVMDSGSSDRTEEICLQKGVKFFHQPWLGYAQQKNCLIQKASFDMILSVDADEEISPALSEELRWIKQNHTNGVYALNRLTNYCGTWIYHSGWYPDVKIRLFPKEIQWQGDLVHETLNLKPDMEVIRLKAPLFHYSYYSHVQHRQRADHYSTLTAQKYVQAGKGVFFGQPLFSACIRFLSMYIFKLGFLDGKQGFYIAKISAESNYFKYKEVQRLKGENK
jgi:(heptosyl)LPS beta-1,4-glucosyltransferase